MCWGMGRQRGPTPQHEGTVPGAGPGVCSGSNSSPPSSLEGLKPFAPFPHTQFKAQDQAIPLLHFSNENKMHIACFLFPLTGALRAHAHTRTHTHTHTLGHAHTRSHTLVSAHHALKLTPRAGSFYNRSQLFTSQTGSHALRLLKVSGNNLTERLLITFSACSDSGSCVFLSPLSHPTQQR